MPQTKSNHESLREEYGKNGGKKMSKNNNTDDPKVRENIVKELYNNFQYRFDIPLIASVAHTCQWDIQRARKALVIMCETKDTQKSKAPCARSNPQWERKKKGKNFPEKQETIMKAQSLPGTLKQEKSGEKKNYASAVRHHGSANSLASGQVWQRHYKSKPQSPGLLTMIPPRGKETSSSFQRNMLTFAGANKQVPETEVKKLSDTVKRILHLIWKGVKVMIIMRGVPGSGKSHLAQGIVNLAAGNQLSHQHILSVDDYFVMLGRGNYAYDYNQLPQAHSWNQARCFESLKRGINPIVVDNTNTQAWEMQPYVVMAVNHGYVVEVVEPITPWRTKIAELANRNVHSVPREKIKQMLERYEPGWTGESLLRSFGLKCKRGGATAAMPKMKSPSNALLAEHRQQAVTNAPEKPQRKRKDRSKRKDRNHLAGVEVTDDRENQLEELNRFFAENGKRLDADSRRKVLESGVPISEVVSRLRNWQENMRPLMEAPDSEPKQCGGPTERLPDCPGTQRDSLSETGDPDTTLSSSDPSEASECETDGEEPEEPKQKTKNYFFGHGASGQFVEDGERMAEEDMDERGIAGKNSSELSSPVDEEVRPLIDFDNVPTSFDLNDLILLSYDDEDNLSPENSSSGSEEELETQMLSLQDSLKKMESNETKREMPNDGTDSEGIGKSSKVESFDSLPNVFAKSLGGSENRLEMKKESEAVKGDGFVDESIFELVLKKYSEKEVEDSDGESGLKTSPDLEEVPLPSVPLVKEEPSDSAQQKESAVPSGSDGDDHPEKKVSEPKSDKFEDIVKSWVHSTTSAEPAESGEDSPRRERSKNNLLGAIRKTGANSRDKSPDELLRSVDLTWSSVNFTSSWEDVRKKPSESSWDRPKPQKKVVSKSDSSTNTFLGDFDLWKKDEEGIVKLIARNRNINQNYKEPETSANQVAEILMLDKGSMTLDEEEVDSLGKDNALDTLSGMFPDISEDHLVDIVEKCKGNLLWAVEVLLETPQNLASVTETGVSPEDNFSSAEGEAKASGNDPDYISLQNVAISDGKKTIRRRKEKKTSASELSLLLKKQIEESIQINEDFYQDKTLFLKKLRHREIEFGDGPIEATVEPPIEEESKEVWESEEDEEEETIPMKMDPEFFTVLSQQFGSFEDCCSAEKVMDLVSPVINIPLSLAQQIYDCWLENVNKQLEEMQSAYDKTVMESELLANALQEQEFEYRQPDLREIMDMELAMLMYKQNQAQLNENSRETMATKLSKQLLFEAYPNMDKKMLLDLFESEGRSFRRTVDVLSAQENQSPVTVVAPEFLAAHSTKLLEQAKAEKFKETLEEAKAPKIIMKPKVTKKEDRSGKNVLLVNPVEYRQETTLLHQRRNECFRLAQEAFRKKSYSVASYFSHLSGLYKDRIKALNREPFPATLFENKLGQDMTKIDLHFLFVPEALQVLDLFLDHHVKELRKKMSSSVKVDLITGRGQHSAKGTSKIKPAVIKRLKQRQFGYVLINPGMLKVTIRKNDLLSDEM